MMQIFLLPLASIEFFGQSLEASDMIVIGALILLEGLLSIDNALVLGMLARRLPRDQQTRALSYGLIGAFVFRIIAITTASFLLQWTLVKLLGGGYLIYIAVKHLFFPHVDEHEIAVDESGHVDVIDPETGKVLSGERLAHDIQERMPPPAAALAAEDPPLLGTPPQTANAATVKPVSMRDFWRTVIVIELTDIAFAVDSILAAMALAGSRREKLWVVVAGGLLGVVLMRFAAVAFMRLLERFPRFELSAYLLVMIIGLKLVIDWGINSDWSHEKHRAVAAVVGDDTLDQLEQSRRRLADRYNHWIATRWIFPSAAETHEEKSADEPSAEEDTSHTPHVLDFHRFSRPESVALWSAMAFCVGIGFLPVRKTSSAGKLA